MDAPAYHLPNRKYYTLPQAIKQIYKLTGEQLEIDDLIHFWIMGDLNLSAFIEVKQSYSKQILETNKFAFGSYHLGFSEAGLLKIGNLVFNENNQAGEWEAVLFVSEYPEIDWLVFYDNDDGLTNVFYEATEEKFTINLCGLFPILSHAQDYQIKNREEGISLNDARTFLIYPHKKQKLLSDFLFTVAINDRLPYDKTIISYDSFYITHKDLISFLNGSSQFVKERRKQIEQNKKTATKTFNAQVQFIRALIIADYGEDIANNIRSELDNPQSPMRLAMEAKGLKPPCGKTVHHWINEN